jgi:pilus assembly protein Flp/PilA
MLLGTDSAILRAIFFERRELSMIKQFLRDERGLELSEYAVAAALVALATVVAFNLLSTKIATRITTLAGYIP